MTNHPWKVRAKSWFRRSRANRACATSRGSIPTGAAWIRSAAEKSATSTSRTPAGTAQSELVRQYHGQIDKPALLIDERFNSGGQIPDRFVEILSRKTLNYWGV